MESSSLTTLDKMLEFPFHLLQTEKNNTVYLMVVFQISGKKLHVENLIHKQSVHISYYNIILSVPRAEGTFFYFLFFSSLSSM